MDTDWNCKKSAKSKRADTLRAGREVMMQKEDIIKGIDGEERGHCKR